MWRLSLLSWSYLTCLATFFGTKFGYKLGCNLRLQHPQFFFNITTKTWNLNIKLMKKLFVDTIFCPILICMPDPKKCKKSYFLSKGLRGHSEWCGTIHSDTKAPRVPFLAIMTKMPLANLGLNIGQTRSKPSQNNTFHSFTSNSSFSEIFGNFDLVWPRVDLEWSWKS